MNQETHRRILHCDLDCFYAAVHMREDPSLKGKPVVVSGNPESRGVVTTANYEARKYGIHSAMPAAWAKRRCAHAVFIRPNFSLYKPESEAVFAIYREFTPLVQPASLDEAYLDVTDHLGDWSSATAIAHEIRRRVREDRGITVTVGVANSKLVAKIASDIQKPDGLTVVRPERVEAFLGPLSVRKIPGVGPVAGKKLGEMGIDTIEDLRGLSLDQLKRRFGVWGERLYQGARGIDHGRVKVERKRKSYGCERTFDRNLSDLGEMEEVIERMAQRVGRGLGQRGLLAETITLKARYPDFKTVTRSKTLTAATNDPQLIAATAKGLLRGTEAEAKSVRLLGVTGSNLVEGQSQLLLFP